MSKWNETSHGVWEAEVGSLFTLHILDRAVQKPHLFGNPDRFSWHANANNCFATGSAASLVQAQKDCLSACKLACHTSLQGLQEIVDQETQPIARLFG